MLNVALPKGRLGEKVYAMFASAGFVCPEVLMESRKLEIMEICSFFCASDNSDLSIS